MSRGSAARSGGAGRFGRIVVQGRALGGGVGANGSPFLRLFSRWVRRPLLPVARLWRRNLQLKIVATTLLMSMGVVLLLGFVVVGQVRNGLLDAKEKAAQSQARGGFLVAQQQANAAGPSTGAAADGAAQGDPRGAASDGRQNASSWMSELVSQLSSGGQGSFDVVALGAGPDSGTVARSPRSSGQVLPLESVPPALRQEVAHGTGTYRTYTRIVYDDTDGNVPAPRAALIIGRQVNDLYGQPYQLYYLFSLDQEARTLSLVKTTLATAGMFVVVLLGAIAWLVVRQVVTPVRMAASVAERLSAGKLQERMKVTGEDDIARLGEAFNKMAQNLQLKIRQLEELSRMQRRFVSDVSHELRTPLTTVRMAADVIHEARADFDPVTGRSAELLADQLDRFESLLADLLEISRFDAGAAALDADAVDLRLVVRRVVDGALPLAERKGSRVRIVGDEQPIVAEADVRRVERVLRNLVVNAVEHGEGRDVVVRLGAAGGAVAVAVRDYGVGLKPGEATRVFSRFWRADPARARTTGGTGLGLSIALEDARLHGGWLQAWGEPGGGSQFRLTLPRTADEPLRGSPIPLEPEDSRAALARAAADSADGTEPGRRTAAVPEPPALPSAVRAPAASRGPVAADPTALPGSGARVVTRARSAEDAGRAAAAAGRDGEPVPETGRADAARDGAPARDGNETEAEVRHAR
ncbi:MtrAB system histidine kinase MtrB [Streptomyces sp. SPB074]|uniref:MtrAB system histidine kinase MtrB n=1 Tax=Streptomyces sp. (strain SPB074) TaxID=465543 RepID=UPI0001D1E1A2|nr:MtrAB system histidine kinase MtrB [Streptomyces sp. SPB074]EFG64772.1 sensor histidine kinase MtrB [Streptomyces sp. SPB074]